MDGHSQNNLNEFVTVYLFEFAHEGQIIKLKLESEGFDVRLADEMTVQVHNLISHAVGGVKLQVRNKDIPEILPLLQQAGLVINQADEKSRLYIFLEDLLKRFPLLRSWPLELRALLLAGILLTILAFVGFLIFSPSEIEQKEKAALHSQTKSKDNLTQVYLPYADSLAMHDPPSALKYLEELNNKYPDHKRIKRLYGVAYYNMDSFALAKQRFNEILETTEYENPLDLANLAFSEAALSEYDQAILHLRKAAHKDRYYIYYLANMFLQSGVNDSAKHYYRETMAYVDKTSQLASMNDYYIASKAVLDSLSALEN